MERNDSMSRELRDHSNDIGHLYQYLFKMFGKGHKELLRQIRWVVVVDLLLSSYSYFDDFSGLYPFITNIEKGKN